MSKPTFDPVGLLEVLERRAVRVIVVGAFAAQLRGVAGIATRDLDLAPDLSVKNLQALAEALHELGATVRTSPHEEGPLRLPPDGVLLARAPILNLHVPQIGDVDVIHAAAVENDERGPLDYDALRPQATLERVPGAEVQVLVMSEDHWLDAKLSPPLRDKDQLHVEQFELWRRTRG